MSAAIFIAAFVVYGSNGDQFLSTYDSAPTSLLVLNAIEHHRIDFDAFRGGFVQTAAPYVFATTPAGHLQTIFPIGTAILTAPVYVVFDLMAHARGEPLPLASEAFERQRLYWEKLAANVVGALAAVAMFWCLREWTTTGAALALTALFAFGTSMWTIGSLALWQHGSVNLVAIVMTLALARATRAGGRAATLLFSAGGAAAGMLVLVRPTAVVYTLAAAVWVALWERRAWRTFVGAAALPIAAALWWNLSQFGAPAGGYAGDATTYRFSVSAAPAAWAALAVSPSKGLIWYLPFVVPAVAGAVIAWRSGVPRDRLLALLGAAALALGLSYGCYGEWWGGHAYGPRFLTDVDAVCVLLLVPLVAPLVAGVRRRRPLALASAALASVMAVASVAVQFAGANGEADSRWSDVPMDVDSHVGRVWDTSDSQIVRAARFAAKRLAATRADAR